MKIWFFIIFQVHISRVQKFVFLYCFFRLSIPRNISAVAWCTTQCHETVPGSTWNNVPPLTCTWKCSRYLFSQHEQVSVSHPILFFFFWEHANQITNTRWRFGLSCLYSFRANVKLSKLKKCLSLNLRILHSFYSIARHKNVGTIIT